MIEVKIWFTVMLALLAVMAWSEWSGKFPNLTAYTLRAWVGLNVAVLAYGVYGLES